MRKVADKVFLLAMNAAEPPVPQWKKKSAYLAVRAIRQLVKTKRIKEDGNQI